MFSIPNRHQKTASCFPKKFSNRTFPSISTASVKGGALRFAFPCHFELIGSMNQAVLTTFGILENTCKTTGRMKSNLCLGLDSFPPPKKSNLPTCHTYSTGNVPGKGYLYDSLQANDKSCKPCTPPQTSTELQPHKWFTPMFTIV